MVINEFFIQKKTEFNKLFRNLRESLIHSNAENEICLLWMNLFGISSE